MRELITGCVAVMVLFLAVASCSAPPQPIPEETAVMEAMKNVQQEYRSKGSLEEFQQRLGAAAGKIDTLKNTEGRNPCFLSAVEKSFAAYEIVQKAWKMRDAAKSESRRTDLDITIAFTMGFASVSMDRANECFEPQ